MGEPHDFRLFEAMDSIGYDDFVEKYEPAPEHFEDDGMFHASREEIREIQEERLQWKIEQAWEVPFFRRRWEEAGITPDDINGLDDLNKIPIYDIEDIRESLDRDPPMGDYQGAHLHDADDAPLRIFTSGGTTGEPRPQIYTLTDREVQAIEEARGFWMQGLRPGDVVQITASFSLHNAAWIHNRGLHHYLGATPVTTGTGNVTPSSQQLQFASKWDVNAFVGSAPYLIHLARKAKEEEYDLEEDFSLKCLSVYGPNVAVERVEEEWGVPAYNNYGFHEVGTPAAECEHADGMHIFEDLQIVQIVDPETGEEVEPGEKGEIVITELYKTGAPQVRYNIHDISRLVPERCECGSEMRRLEDFLGRGDNMVKVRGINVWPEAIGKIVAEHPETNGEYYCIADKDGETLSTEMTVLVETVSDPSTDPGELKAALEDELEQRLDVFIEVQIRENGGLTELTELGQRAKIKRFEDRR